MRDVQKYSLRMFAPYITSTVFAGKTKVTAKVVKTSQDGNMLGSKFNVCLWHGEQPTDHD